MSNRTNFQLINSLSKHIDTESLQINMSDSIYFTVKTSRELDFNDIFEVARIMEQIMGEEVEFVEKRTDNYVVFRCIAPKREEIEYKANSKAIRRKIEDYSFEPPEENSNTILNYAIVIFMTVVGTLIISYLLSSIITVNTVVEATLFGLLVVVIAIGILFPIILFKD